MASSHRAAPAGRKREGAALPGQRGGGGGGEERGLRPGLPAVQPARRARLCREGRGSRSGVRGQQTSRATADGAREGRF